MPIEVSCELTNVEITWSESTLYERGWPSDYNIPAGGKNDGVRKVQICVRKLAANSAFVRFPSAQLFNCNA